MNKVLELRRDKQPVDASTDQVAPRRKRGWWRGVLVVALLAAGLGWWWHRQASLPAQATRPVEAATVVALGTVGRADVPVTLDALGTVTAISTVTVKTQISGKLIEVGFKEGQSVKKGDFLAQIDPQPYQAALEVVKGQLARDEALLATAKLDLARYDKLVSQDSLARQTRDTQASLVKQDEATVITDRANVQTATLNLNYCRILSPSEGRVGLRLVDLGNYVQASDASGIATITQMHPISVIFTLAQDTIPQFLPKLRAGEALPVLAFSRNNSTRLAAGTLTTIDNQIDTTTGTVKLRATFPNTDEALFPNQFVNIKLVVETLHDAIVVPSAAVQLGSPGAYVYLAKDESTVSVRPIKLGPVDGQNVVVTEGLAVGDKVVVDGIDRLRDGARIRTAQSAAQGASKGARPTGAAATSSTPGETDRAPGKGRARKQ